MNYTPVRRGTSHLVCFKSDDGNGLDREYMILLSASHMQVVNLKDNTKEVFVGKREQLDEYKLWKHGKFKAHGYKACSIDHYLQAQDMLERRLKGGRVIYVGELLEKKTVQV